MTSATDRRQLAFDVAARRPRFGRADFDVMDSNRAALATLDAFIGSREPALAICGPVGAGKTHLAHILAAENGVQVRDAACFDLGPTGIERAAGETVLLVIDNVEACADPKRLLALIEARRARGAKLALAGRGKPADWSRGLKDLATRLEAMTRVSLDEPDEALMRAVIAHRFRERQWRTGPGIVAYAAPRLPRTFAAAAAFVEAVGAAIAGGERVNLTLARKVIDTLSEAGAPE